MQDALVTWKNVDIHPCTPHLLRYSIAAAKATDASQYLFRVWPKIIQSLRRLNRTSSRAKQQTSMVAFEGEVRSHEHQLAVDETTRYQLEQQNDHLSLHVVLRWSR